MPLPQSFSASYKHWICVGRETPKLWAHVGGEPLQEPWTGVSVRISNSNQSNFWRCCGGQARGPRPSRENLKSTASRQQLGGFLSHGPAACLEWVYYGIRSYISDIQSSLFIWEFLCGVVGFVVFETISELAPNSVYHKGWPWTPYLLSPPSTCWNQRRAPTSLAQSCFVILCF